MSRPPTIDDARQSLSAHVAEKGFQIREKYGPHIGWEELLQILAERAFVRYPCEIVFDAGRLREGELAWPMARGETPEEGFTMYVHPLFALQPERVPHLVLYQLAVVNYGKFVSPDDAETFGASALGLSKDEYYRALCVLADELTGNESIER